MDAEQRGVAPEALQIRFPARVNDVATDLQYNQMYRNVQGLGLIDWLGPDAANNPWDAYLGIMDGIVAAAPVDVPTPSPTTATVAVTFRDLEVRDRFRRFCSYAWAGIYPDNMPWVDESGPEGLTISNFSYPDVATLGRLGTIFMDRQHPELGRNRRLVIARRISEIAASGVMDYLPDVLLERIAQQREQWGALAEDMFLSGCNLGAIGDALRRALEEQGVQEFEVQRPKGDRPYSEEGARFYPFTPEGSKIPTSRTTPGKKFMGDLAEPVDQLREPFRKHKRLRGVIELAIILWELGIKEGGLAIFYAVGTFARAVGSAAFDKFEDYSTRKGQGLGVTFSY